jgi:hypothetical protein
MASPTGGRRYEYVPSDNQGTTGQEIDWLTPIGRTPTQQDALVEEYPYDSPGSAATYPGEPDTGYRKPQNPEQWHGDFGPFYQSPEFSQWLQQNVWDQGLYVDWGNMTIIDGDGNIVGQLPRTPPRMT